MGMLPINYVWLWLLFPPIFFFLFFVIVGTDFVSNEDEDDGEAEDTEDEDGEEDHVALLPSLRQGRILCRNVRQVFNNRPTNYVFFIDM